MRFEKAVITKKNENTFILNITWSYVGYMCWEETFIYNSLDDCKNKLIQIRCRNNLIMIDEKGEERNLLILK